MDKDRDDPNFKMCVMIYIKICTKKNNRFDHGDKQLFYHPCKGFIFFKKNVLCLSIIVSHCSIPIIFSHESAVDKTVKKVRIKDNLLVTDMDTKWKFTEKRPEVRDLLKDYKNNFVALKLSETIEETVTVIEEPEVKETYNMNVLSSDEDDNDNDCKPAAKAKTSKSGSDPEHDDDDSSTNTYLGEGNHKENPTGELEIASTAMLPAKGNIPLEGNLLDEEHA